MRKDIANRLAKLEVPSPAGTIRVITIRGDSTEEQKAELSRLRAAGAVHPKDWWIAYEPRKKGKPTWEVEEIPSWWLREILREIDEDARSGTSKWF